MDSLNDSVTFSLDGSDADLFPHFPYLLQDIWELGSSAKVVLDLINNNKILNEIDELKILDLGCGKGAVSIPVTEELGGTLLGLDAVPEFIDDANLKASEYGIDAAAEFRVADIRKEIKKLSGFNLIMLASIGPVLGNIEQTLSGLRNCLIEYGYVFLDDGYLRAGSLIKSEGVLDENEFYRQIDAGNFEVVDKYVWKREEMEASNKEIYSAIEARTKELIFKYPGQKLLFENYLREQAEENYNLENNITCASLLLRKL